MAGKDDEDEDKKKDKEIERQIKKAGDKVEPADKDALAKIRQRTGAGKRGNGKGKKDGKKR